MSLGGDKNIRRKPVRRKFMKKILQKSLASMVSAALCLTAFVGCLTVNAAEYAGTISSAGTTVSETATEAKVTLTLSSPDAAMNIAAIAATTDFGTLTAVEVEGTNCKIDDIKDLAKGRFYVDAIDNNKGFNTAAVTLTFTKAEKVGVGNHPVTITYFAKKSAATINEDIVNLTVSGDINITVTSAHTHTWEYVSATPATETATGTMTVRCAVCGEEKQEILKYNKFNTIVETGASAESEIIFRLSALSTVIKADDITETFIVVNNTVHTSAEAFNTETNVYQYEDATINGNKITWNVGVPAIYMTESVIVSVYSKCNGEWYNGVVTNSVFSEFALNLVQGSATDAIKTVLVDAVNYGANAQIATGHYTSNLANAAFDAYQYNGDTPYGSDTTVIPNVTNDTVNNNTGTVWFVGVGLEAESKIVLRPQILPHPSKFTGNVNDIVVVASYTDSLNVQRNIAFVNDAAALSSLPANISVDTVEKLNTAPSGYYVPLSTIASNELDITVSFQIYVAGVADSSSTCSVEDAVAMMRGSATESQVAAHNALLRYGNSAKIAFG